MKLIFKDNKSHAILHLSISTSWLNQEVGGLARRTIKDLVKKNKHRTCKTLNNSSTVLNAKFPMNNGVWASIRVHTITIRRGQKKPTP